MLLSREWLPSLLVVYFFCVVQSMACSVQGREGKGRKGGEKRGRRETNGQRSSGEEERKERKIAVSWLPQGRLKTSACTALFWRICSV